MKNFILFLVLIISYSAAGQPIENKKSDKPKNISYFLNNKAVKKDALKSLNRDSILAVTLLKDSDAVKITGDRSTDAVVSIISASYGIIHHLDYLKSKSKDFSKAYSSIQNPDEVVFIWNDKVLDKRKENMLYFINDSNFIEIKTISKDELISNFNINDKQLGFLVKTTSKNSGKQ